MKVGHVLLPVCAMNCYLAINEKTNESIIVDPGSAPERIKSAVAESGTKPVAILLTHGHFDHAGAAADIAKEYGLQVYAFEGEKETLENPQYNLSGMMGAPESYHADIFVKDDEELDLAGLHLKVLYTPGHTEGGCCFYFPEEGIVFTGDSLFCGSVGRTDFPGGSMSRLIGGIKEKLMSLPEDTICYPGHDSATTIGEERMYNMYL